MGFAVDTLPLPARLTGRLASSVLAALLPLAAVILSVAPAISSYARLSALRSDVAVSPIGSDAFGVPETPAQTSGASSASLAAGLARLAGERDVQLRDLPRAESIAVSDELTLETYRLELAGRFEDHLRFVRDLELGSGTAPLDQPHSLVSLASVVERNRETRQRELVTRLVLRRLVNRVDL